MTYRLSVVVPVLNERSSLPIFIQKVREWQDNDIEFIFVDGGSKDGTQDFLLKEEFKVLEGVRGRGGQLDKGAKHAQGENLLFLHADSYFLKSPKDEILNCLSNGKIGAFPIKFETRSLFMKGIALGSNWRLKKRQIAFGDQAIFMRKDYYDDLGGFRYLPLMEDYDLSIRNKNNKEPLMIAKCPIVTSMRRFKNQGIFRTLLKMQYCQYLFRKQVSMQKIMNVYYS